MNRKLSPLLLALLLVLSGAGCSRKSTHESKIETAPEQKSATAPSVPESAVSRTAEVTAPKEAAPARTTIRIVAWNLEWFPGHKPNPEPGAEAQQMESAKAALAELKPDIMLMEEVRDWESAAELCKAVPGLEVHVVSRFQPRPQNQVIASKFPVNSTWSEVWHSDGVTPPRGYVFAALELPNHHFLLTYALHLKSNLGEFATNALMRQAATKQVLRHTKEMLALYEKQGPCAVVIGGDMNTSLDDPKFAQDLSLSAFTKSGFHWTHEGVPFADRNTIPGKGGFADNCFDHIFTAGLGKPVASVSMQPGISDHNPVVLDVDLTKANFQPKLDVEAGITLLGQSTAGVPTPPPAVLSGTVDATDIAALTAAAGKIAKVKGRVKRVSSTKNNSVYFIDFEGAARGGFTAVVKQAYYASVVSGLGGELDAVLVGKTVELKGVVALYKDAPQIVVTAPDQIKVTR